MTEQPSVHHAERVAPACSTGSARRRRPGWGARCRRSCRISIENGAASALRPEGAVRDSGVGVGVGVGVDKVAAPDKERPRRRPVRCGSYHAIAGDGRPDALADPRLASKRLADSAERSLTRLLMTKISRAELTISRSLRALAIAQSQRRHGDSWRDSFRRGAIVRSRRRRRASASTRSLATSLQSTCLLLLAMNGAPKH